MRRRVFKEASEHDTGKGQLLFFVGVRRSGFGGIVVLSPARPRSCMRWEATACFCLKRTKEIFLALAIGMLFTFDLVLVDLEMLVLTPRGRERTEAEFAKLLLSRHNRLGAFFRPADCQRSHACYTVMSHQPRIERMSASASAASLQPEPGINRKAIARGFWCGVCAFAFWCVMGVESVLRPFQDNRRDTFWVLPFVLTVATFRYVHTVQRRRSRVETVGYVIVLIASALVLLGNIGLQLNIKALESLGFPGGAIVWLVGLVCFGIGTLIAGALPKYAAWALILLEPSSILAALALSPIAPLLPRGAYSGNVGKGVAMGIIALGLRSVVRPKFDMPDRGD